MKNSLIKGIEERERLFDKEFIEPRMEKQKVLVAEVKEIKSFIRANSVTLLQALVVLLEQQKKDQEHLIRPVTNTLSDTIATLKETLLALEAKG